MRKSLLVLVVAAGTVLAGSLTTSTAASAPRDGGAAAILSAVMPGAGEWYNSNFKGAFPWGECVIGHICCLVQLSSIMDAANGATDNALRIDFWSEPSGR